MNDCDEICDLIWPKTTRCVDRMWGWMGPLGVVPSGEHVVVLMDRSVYEMVEYVSNIVPRVVIMKGKCV